MASPLQQNILTTLQEQCQRLDYDMFVVLQPSTNSKSKLWTATGSLKNLFGSLISEIANYIDVDGSDSTDTTDDDVKLFIGPPLDVDEHLFELTEEQPFASLDVSHYDHSALGSEETENMFEFTEEPPVYLDSLIKSLEDVNDTDDQEIDNSTTHDPAPDDQAFNDQATDDQATNDQATDDQATDDQATDDLATDDLATDDLATDNQSSNDQEANNYATNLQPNRTPMENDSTLNKITKLPTSSPDLNTQKKAPKSSLLSQSYNCISIRLSKKQECDEKLSQEVLERCLKRNIVDSKHKGHRHIRTSDYVHHIRAIIRKRNSLCCFMSKGCKYTKRKNMFRCEFRCAMTDCKIGALVTIDGATGKLTLEFFSGSRTQPIDGKDDDFVVVRHQVGEVKRPVIRKAQRQEIFKEDQKITAEDVMARFGARSNLAARKVMSHARSEAKKAANDAKNNITIAENNSAAISISLRPSNPVPVPVLYTLPVKLSKKPEVTDVLSQAFIEQCLKRHAIKKRGNTGGHVSSSDYIQPLRAIVEKKNSLCCFKSVGCKFTVRQCRFNCTFKCSMKDCEIGALVSVQGLTGKVTLEFFSGTRNGPTDGLEFVMVSHRVGEKRVAFRRKVKSLQALNEAALLSGNMMENVSKDMEREAELTGIKTNLKEHDYFKSKFYFR